MNQHPIVLIEPVFKWLDYLIATYGLEIYMVMVWLSPLLILWILRGSFWRRPVRPQRIVKPPPLPKRLVAPPPPLPESGLSSDEQSFAM